MLMPFPIINRTQLITMLMNQKGSTFIGFVATTFPNLMPYSGKNRNPYEPNRIIKIQRGSSIICAHYDKAVCTQLAKQIDAQRKADGLPPLSPPDMEAEINRLFRRGANWQDAVIRNDGTLTGLAHHKNTNELYLRSVNYKPSGKPFYFDTQEKKYVDQSEIKPFLPKRSNYENQGILNQQKRIHYKVWKLNNIRWIKMNNSSYTVFHTVDDSSENPLYQCMADILKKNVPNRTKKSKPVSNV